jgi:hypothetical protein
LSTSFRRLQFFGEPTHALGRFWWLKFRRRRPLANVKGGFQLPDLSVQRVPLWTGRELGDLRFQPRFLGCYLIFKFMREGSFPTLHIQPRAYGLTVGFARQILKCCHSAICAKVNIAALLSQPSSVVPSAAGTTISPSMITEPGLICHASAATFGSGWSSRCLVGQTTGRPRSTELDRHKLSGRVCLPTGPDRLLLGCWPALRVDLRLVAGQRMVCPQAKVERSCQKHRGPKLTAILTLCHARW